MGKVCVCWGWHVCGVGRCRCGYKCMSSASECSTSWACVACLASFPALVMKTHSHSCTRTTLVTARDCHWCYLHLVSSCSSHGLYSMAVKSIDPGATQSGFESCSTNSGLTEIRILGIIQYSAATPGALCSSFLLWTLPQCLSHLWNVGGIHDKSTQSSNTNSCSSATVRAACVWRATGWDGNLPLTGCCCMHSLNPLLGGLTPTPHREAVPGRGTSSRRLGLCFRSSKNQREKRFSFSTCLAFAQFSVFQNRNFRH